ncbi:MAG: hypothetical protein QHC89_29440, partial [Bosea sp. (in: a-proteobacteria)]|nr:hypothetical protein [Bosea sp. (in: a-proteobacteria)]
MIEAMARRAAALHPAPNAVHEAGRPGIHVLEQASSLEAFFDAPPDFSELFDHANQLLGKHDRLQVRPLPSETAHTASEGMLILAYAKLLRIAIWPARSEGDLATKIAARALVDERNADPDRNRALFTIAMGQGETIARQSDRFMNLGREN